MASKSQSPTEPSSLSEEYAALILYRQQLPLLRSRLGDVVPAVGNSLDSATMGRPVHGGTYTLGQQQLCLHLYSSQLLKLVNEENMSTPGATPTSAVQTQKPKCPSVRVACVNCRNAKKACGVERPCARCVRLQLGGCEDAPTKREKPAFGSIGVNIGTTVHYPELAADGTSPTANYQAPRIDSEHTTPSITEAMHVSARLPDLPAEQPFDIARWTEAQAGTTISHSGTTSQVMHAYGNPGWQDRIAVAQSAIPSAAMHPPATGYPSPVDMQVFPHYSPEYVASQVNDGVPGNAQMDYCGMYMSSQGSAASPPYYGGWQGQ